ncbi:MAG: helix-turn-helix domain-containing GNAT family N-acetyltransferase [Streptosporangiales bacterium]|nr:helix-turn-helix domain-containing GNAT family N-acetyltransferase [Streptosporangiales bacterium]
MTAEQQTATVRRFNRAYTQRIGALEDSFLGMGLPLPAIRLMFEIGSRPGTVRDLRARLGLDSGYLSRLLRRLESDGLVTVAPDPADRRRRVATLTGRGRERWNELEARSEERARTLIDPLTPRQRTRLTAALAEADLLVRAATVTLAETDPAEPEARAAVQRYFDEMHRRFGFDSSGEDIKDAAMLCPPDGAFIVAVSDGEPVACGGLQTIAPGIGEIKRMWVDETWRGAGLGSRVLRDLEKRAAALGHHTLRLDTNETLAEAIAMYERAGYQRVARYNDNPFATDFFERPLF